MNRLKIILKTLFVFIIAISIVCTRVSLADSGFDYSYDSVGSSGYSGGSSWDSYDSSSSSGGNYSYSGGYGNYYGTDIDTTWETIMAIFVIIIVITLILTPSPYKPRKSLIEYSDEDKVNRVLERIKKANKMYTKEYILSLISNAYIDYQKCYNDRNLDKLKRMASEKLYLFLEGKFNDFKRENCYQVIEVEKVNNIEIKKINLIDSIINVEVLLNSSEKNYYVDDNSKFLKGNKEIEDVKYILGLDIDIRDNSIVFNTKVKDFSDSSEYRSIIDSVSTESLLKLDSSLTIENIIKETYKTYESLQYAWSNFDYEGMRKLVSDEIYNDYIYQLDTLKLKKQQNVMKDIEFVNGTVTSADIHNNVVYLKVHLNVKQVDYIEDDNGNLIRGDKNKHFCTYELDLEKGFNASLTNCPNCGAEINDSASKTCSFCGAELIDISNNYVIVKKRMITQR